MPALYPDASTYIEIRRAVRDLLNEPVAVFWSDDEIDRYIQLSCVELSRHSIGVEQRELFPLTGGREYLIGSYQLLRIYAMVFSPSGNIDDPENEALIRIHPMMIRHTNVDDTPKQYYRFGNMVGIYPDTGVGFVYMYFSHAVDHPSRIPNNIQTLVIYHTMFLCRLKERKNQEAAMYFAYYVNALRQYRADIWERVPDSKDKFQIPDRTVIRVE